MPLSDTVEDHKHHDTVSAAVQRTEKQAQLTLTKGKFQQRIQEREKELQDLRQALQLLKYSAQAAVEDSDRIFSEIILSIKRRCCAVKKLIRDQEKAEVTRAEGLLERLEQEIAELKRREAELEQLLQTEDHIHFLQNYQPHCTPPGPGNALNITFDPHFTFQNPVRSVSELKEHLEDVCKGGLLKITESVNEVGILQIPQPTTREDFLQYYCHLTLDPNTANPKLSLSEGNREVTRVEKMQSYPDHPARFDYWEQGPSDTPKTNKEFSKLPDSKDNKFTRA
ncbi:hypothetical protein GJAV_G00069350 [Gymnothorax javanicus]|nr:hypothetical protein GJAV_G00069350 [Gymnothorax javanicus]